MRRAAIILLCLLMSYSGFGQSKFVGTMWINDYAREDIAVEVYQKDNLASGVMHKVRLSRTMPITFSVHVYNLHRKQDNNKIIITGKDVIPHVGGKAYKNYIMTDFYAVIENDNLTITTQMGKKKVKYKGKKI